MTQPNEIRVTLPYPPSANRLWANGQRGAKFKTDEYQAFEEHARLKLNSVLDAPFAGHVAVTLHVYRPRKAGDLDNRGKAVLDVLQGVAYVSDAQIVELHSYRHDDKLNPRVEVCVREVTV